MVYQPMGVVRRVQADMISAYLPVRTISELNAREHWSKRKRRAAEHRRVAFMKLRPLLAVDAHWPPLVCVLIRIGPRALDGDNLQGALKHVRDGVADATGVDDGSDQVTWVYGQRRGLAREYAVRVEVWTASSWGRRQIFYDVHGVPLSSLRMDGIK